MKITIVSLFVVFLLIMLPSASVVESNVFEDKIVIIGFRRIYGKTFEEKYEKLFNKHPLGVVMLDLTNPEVTRSLCGSPITNGFSKLPTMLAPAAKAAPIHDQLFTKNFQLRVKGNVTDSYGHNVSTTIRGRNPKTIILCAHHDTVEYTQGARDNAGGVAVLLELPRVLAPLSPRFTYRFISISGEEMGLVGSKKYVEEHDLSKVILCLNFDVMEPLPGMIHAYVAGEDELVEIVKEIMVKNPYPALTMKEPMTGGDNRSFVAEGVPAIHLAFAGCTPEGIHHTPKDTPRGIAPRALGELGRFSLRLINRLEQMDEVEFPVTVPEDLLKKVKDGY